MNFLSSVEAVITQIHLTSHAQVRVQQRGVDRTVLDCLLRYGRREFDHCGGQILRFDNAALYAVSRNESAWLWVKAVEARSLYAVVSVSGTVITTGHRFRRVLRDKSISSFRTRRSSKPRIAHS